jgi:hypothetical protein
MKLRMSKELSLPLDAVTQKLAFIGRTGSGKTYAATKLAELFGEAGAQFIALDPVGKWWSLRLKSDGKSAGLDVPVFGGLHGDLPLEPLLGARIADLIVDRQISAVLDVSQFEHNTDKARFAESFATRLFYRKKSSPSAAHLFVEEAQEFVPQNPQGEEKRMLGAFERLIKLGRNFGIGASLISQRPQEINKKALNQTECLFVFQTTGTHERKAIDAWIADKGIDEDIARLLPGLHVGEARVWSPAWLRVSLTTTIDPKRTFDASATPKVGAKSVEVKTLTPIDIVEITKSLADVVEKAKADDPRELKKRIAELEKRAPKTADPLLSKEQEKLLTEIREEITGMNRGGLANARAEIARCVQLFERFVVGVGEQAARVERLVNKLDKIRQPNGSLAAPYPTVHEAIASMPGRKSADPIYVESDTNDNLPKGERAVLTAIAQNPDGATRDQVSALTGFKKQTRDAYVGRLVRRGFVHDPVRGGPLQATPEGIAALGASFKPLPTGDALVAYWKAKLPQGECAIFSTLVEAWPGGLTREVISDQTGFVKQTRDAYIGRLVRRKIVEKPTRGGDVYASKALMKSAEEKLG